MKTLKNDCMKLKKSAATSSSLSIGLAPWAALEKPVRNGCSRKTMCADSDHEKALRLKWYCGAAAPSSCARRDMVGGPSGFAGTTGSAPAPGSSLLGAGVSGAAAGSGAGSPPDVGADDGTRLCGGGRGLLAGIGPSGFAGTTGSAPAPGSSSVGAGFAGAGAGSFPGSSSVGACVFTFFDGDAVGLSVGWCLWCWSAASGTTVSTGASVNPAPFSMVYGPFSNHIPTMLEHPGPPLSQITNRSGFVTVSRCFANQKKYEPSSLLGAICELTGMYPLYISSFLSPPYFSSCHHQLK